MASMGDVLFIGDPWDTLDHPRDSTLHLARVARAAHGTRSFWTTPERVYLSEGRFFAAIVGEVSCEAPDSPHASTELHPAPAIRELSSFHSVHWRADPPITLATMRLWSLLAASGGEKGVLFVNAPQALLTWNEKFAPLRFGTWAIQGLVSDLPESWRAYFGTLSARGAQIIAKPSGEAASRGVKILPASWDDAEKELRAMREEHGSWIVMQEFDRALLTVGETRVFTLGPTIAGAINKRPHPSRMIMNLDAPPDERPTLTVAALTDEQRHRASEIAQVLAAEGVYLATIDFIGDRILEINVTSPGLISWLDARVQPSERLAERYWKGLLG